MAITAKSVVIDIADAYDPYNGGIRSIDFYLGGTIIALIATDFTAAASQEFLLPPVGIAEFAFDTSLSKSGDAGYTTWFTDGANPVNNERLYVVFNTPQTFDKVVVNNFHENGFSTNYGVKNIKIYSTSDTVASTVYGNGVSGYDLLYDDVLPQHDSNNAADDIIVYEYIAPTMDVLTGAPDLGAPVAKILLSEPVTVKTLIIDIADAYGTDFAALRSVELFLDFTLYALTQSDFTAYTTNSLGSLKDPKYAFDTTVSKLGTGENETSWMSEYESTTNLRLSVVLDTPVSINSVTLNNFHNSGFDTSYGIKNIKIYALETTETSTVYGAGVTTANMIFDGQLAAHTTENEIDDQILTLLEPAPSMDVITGPPVIGSPLAMLSCAPDNILTGVPIIPTITGYTLAGMTDVLSGVPIVNSVTASIVADETFDLDIAIPVKLSLASGTGIDIALPSFNLTGSCYSGRIGDVDITFPSMSLLMEAGNNIGATLPILTLSGTLSKEEWINIFCQLPSLQASLSSSFSPNGDIEANLAAFQMTMSSLTGSSVDLGGIFPKLIMINTLLNGTVGDIDMMLPMIQAEISSIVTGDNDLEATFPRLLLSINADKLSHYALNYVKGKVR